MANRSSRHKNTYQKYTGGVMKTITIEANTFRELRERLILKGLYDKKGQARSKDGKYVMVYKHES